MTDMQDDDTPPPAIYQTAAELGLDELTVATLDALADQGLAGLRATTKVRPTIVREARNAVKAGQAPERLLMNSLTNMSYQRKADQIWESGKLIAAALEKLAEGALPFSPAVDAIAMLRGMEIKGVNTYAKALRRYRDLWVEWGMARLADQAEGDLNPPSVMANIATEVGGQTPGPLAAEGVEQGGVLPALPTPEAPPINMRGRLKLREKAKPATHVITVLERDEEGFTAVIDLLDIPPSLRRSA